MDKESLSEVFGYEIENFIKMPFSEVFIDFFTTKGYRILTGDLNVLDELKRNQVRRADKYTSELINQQNLNAADTAWINNNYLDFIKYLDLTDKATLPKSYEIKYSIAKNKIK